MSKVMTEDQAIAQLAWRPSRTGGSEIWAKVIVTGVGHKSHVAEVTRFSAERCNANSKILADGYTSIRVNRPECGSERYNSNPNTSIVDVDGEITCLKCQKLAGWLAK